MARISENNRLDFAPLADAQDRYVMIDRPQQGVLFAQHGDVGLFVGAAVDGEVGPSRFPGDLRRFERRQRLGGGLQDSVFKGFGVCGDSLFWVVLQRVHRLQIRPDDRPAMRVGTRENDPIAVQAVGGLQSVAYPI